MYFWSFLLKEVLSRAGSCSLQCNYDTVWAPLGECGVCVGAGAARTPGGWQVGNKGHSIQ